MDAQKVILVLGAGRSSSSLIAHLLGQSEGEGWQIHVGDLDLAAAQSKVQGHPHGHAFQMSSSDAADRDARIASADLVISMLPAFMHPEVARVAIEAGVHVLTPSYVSDDMQALDRPGEGKGVLVLNEMGLDPGIDHMSAMQVIDEIREAGGTMVSFASYCGGLVAPASDDNPWHYKLSWNPRNVVLAGQGGAATFLDRGRVRMVPPHKTFQALTPVEVGGRRYDGYPNRDSLGYQELYGLQGIQSLVRGTLRGEGYCQAWDVLVQLGMVRDDVRLTWPAGTTWAGWTRTFLPAHLDAVQDVREAVARATGAADEALDKMAWLGLFDDDQGAGRPRRNSSPNCRSLGHRQMGFGCRRPGHDRDVAQIRIRPPRRAQGQNIEPVPGGQGQHLHRHERHGGLAHGVGGEADARRRLWHHGRGRAHVQNVLRAAARRTGRAGHCV